MAKWKGKDVLLGAAAAIGIGGIALWLYNKSQEGAAYGVGGGAGGYGAGYIPVSEAKLYAMGTQAGQPPLSAVEISKIAQEGPVLTGFPAESVKVQPLPEALAGKHDIPEIGFYVQKPEQVDSKLYYITQWEKGYTPIGTTYTYIAPTGRKIVTKEYVPPLPISPPPFIPTQTIAQALKTAPKGVVPVEVRRLIR